MVNIRNRQFRQVAVAWAALTVMLVGPVWARGQQAGLTERLDAAVQPVARRAFVGVCVQSLTRGDVLYERNADLPFTPASNQKLLTSAAALHRFGPDQRFRTEVLALGSVVNGVLEGDLVLRGGGDPVLESAHLQSLAQHLRDAGIVRVTGNLRADESLFDDERLGAGWQADDEPYYYSAQISALSVDRNVVGVQVRPGSRARSRAKVTLKSLAPGYFKVENRARTGSGSLRVTRRRSRNVILVSGSVTPGRMENESVTLENPALYTATSFRKALAKQGVSIDGDTRLAAIPKGEGQVLAQHESPPLADILALLNKPSDNLVAEMLLKHIGTPADRTGPGTAERGMTALTELITTIQQPAPAFRPADGSGLSRVNLVSPRTLVSLLTWMDTQPYAGVYKSSLPIAGVDGTLRLRLKDTVAAENARAKTGTLTGVTALSGYVVARNGERLVFSAMTNNWPGYPSRTSPPKRMEDAVALALAEFSR